MSVYDYFIATIILKFFNRPKPKMFGGICIIWMSSGHLEQNFDVILRQDIKNWGINFQFLSA